MTAQGDLTKLQETAFRREFPLFDNTMFKNVYFIPEKLSDKELQALMQSCETYISPSRAEGQNLPLCEAMYSSRITIAPDHTSMKDFINGESTILLDHHPWTIDETTHKYSDFWGFSWYNIPEDTILNALNKKMSLTNGQKQFIIDKAKQNIENFSSESAVLAKWQKIKEDLKLA
jgi:glycosyltransferase involved in cell wall biosynthesis